MMSASSLNQPAWFSWPVRQALILGVLVFLTRLPFLGHGYGSDADAWRVIAAGQHLLDTGRYLPSRPPGYPLPEFAIALLMWLGVGTPWVVGAISALLSAVSASLMALVCAPLGWWRAAAAAVALAFTPVVFIASLNAMDYLWGLSFFLAASLCAMRGRWLWAALWLGLAASSRPTYALCFLPLAWVTLQVHGLSLLDKEAWRRLVPMALLSGGITLAFFIPAVLEIGWRVASVPGGNTFKPAWLVYNASVLLFGLIGSVCVALALVLAWFKRHSGVTLPAQQAKPLQTWAWLLIGLYLLMYLRLPDEASYLMPAVLALYYLLARYSPRPMMAVLAVGMIASSFVLSIARDAQGRPNIVLKGPVPREIDLQYRRACVAGVISQHLAHAPPNEMIITAEYRPQLMAEVGSALAGRILYTVRKDDSGAWVDTEEAVIPPGARLIVLDRAQSQQTAEWPLQPGEAGILQTQSSCP